MIIILSHLLVVEIVIIVLAKSVCSQIAVLGAVFQLFMYGAQE